MENGVEVLWHTINIEGISDVKRQELNANVRACVTACFRHGLTSAAGDCSLM